MKIVGLNCLGGKFGQVFFEYIKMQSRDTQVFCFSEVSYGNKHNMGAEVCENLLLELRNILTDFIFFKYEDELYDGGCMTVFVKNNLKAELVDQRVLATIPIQDSWNSTGLAMAVLVEDFKIVNVHGMHKPGDKMDTDTRIKQSEELLAMVGAKTVLIGDFNLSPESRSVKMLGEKMQDLNTMFNVTDTRGPGLVEYWGKSNYQPFADFGFATEDIKVKSFYADEVVVSDHKPLVLEIE